MRFPTIRLGTIAVKIGSGSTPKGGSDTYVEYGVPFVRSQNVTYDKLSLHDVAYISLATHETMSGSKVLPGDILLNITGASLGRSCVVPDSVSEANVNQHVCIIRTKKTDQHYIQAYLSSYDGQCEILRNEGGGGREGLNFSGVGSIEVPLPPLPIQRRIAAILQTWDRAITLAEQQLADLQERKRGLMQLLLTGKERLPGFAGAWEEVRLGEVGTVMKGAGLTKDDLLEVGAPCIRYAELYTTYSTHIKSVYSHTSEGVASNCLPLQTGDLLFPCSGEDRIDIATASAYLAEDGCVAGGDMLVLRPRQALSSFLGYCLNQDNVRKQFHAVAQGVSVVHVYKSNFDEITVSLPPRAEQVAIAGILDAISAEITTVLGRIEALRLQKKGLMQRLLEGEIQIGEQFEKYVHHE